MEEGLSASLSLLSLIALLLIVLLVLSSLIPALESYSCDRMVEARQKLRKLADSLDLDASDYLKRVVGC
ncbi:MAG: hypothetical protein QI197_00545 [Candidatus Korarchaeota archaeon]|nr:hypothetical protein [Candidatus Korarchaeota archaeon]